MKKSTMFWVTVAGSLTAGVITSLGTFLLLKLTQPKTDG